VQKYSLYFTEILIIDGAGVDELNGAIGGSFVINVREVADLFGVEDLYTMRVDLETVLGAFEDDGSEPDMKDGSSTC
jgi:hypothetical protein